MDILLGPRFDLKLLQLSALHVGNGKKYGEQHIPA